MALRQNQKAAKMATKEKKMGWKWDCDEEKGKYNLARDPRVSHARRVFRQNNKR